MIDQSLCRKCNVTANVTEVGTASGRKHYRCPKCGAAWREKNPAAMALGSMGGKKAAENMSEEERSQRGAIAATARWLKDKLS